jgi:membrane protein
MAGITARPPTVTDLDPKRRAAAQWKPRLASAGLAALLLAIGFGPKRHSVERVSERPQTRLTAKRFVLSLYQRISDDRVVAISGGVTFFALLAIFPATAAIVSVYGLFAGMKSIHADLSALSSLLPGGAIAILGEEIKRLVAQGDKTLGLAALGGIAFSIWSANAGMKSLFDALNIVLREKETRGFIKLNAVSLAFTAGGLVFVLLAMATVLAVPAFLKSVTWNHELEFLIAVGRWPIIWAVLAFGIALLYRFGPGHNDIPWRWLSWGSGTAALVWLIASLAFSYYAAHFGTFNKTYGSLGAGVGFMTWIWISVIVILIGEEVNEILDTARKPEKAEKPHPLGVAGSARARDPMLHSERRGRAA